MSVRIFPYTLSKQKRMPAGPSFKNIILAENPRIGCMKNRQLLERIRVQGANVFKSEPHAIWLGVWLLAAHFCPWSSNILNNRMWTEGASSDVVETDLNTSTQISLTLRINFPSFFYGI